MNEQKFPVNHGPEVREQSPSKPQKGMLLTVLPLYVWTLALVLLPILYVVYMSVIQRDPNFGLVHVFTYENYARIFSSMYIGIFLESLRIAATTTLISLVTAYPFAYFMARLSPKWRSLMLLLVIVPFWTSALVRTYGWVILLRTNGIVNQILMGLGIVKEPLKMLYTEGAVVVGTVYSLLPFMILPLYSSIEKLDWSVVEAARDLGASRGRALLTTVIPLTMPGIVSGCVLVFIPALGLFFISDLLGGATHMLLGNLIHNQMTTARDWPFGAALSVVMIGMTLSLLGLYRRVTGSSVEVF